MKKLLFAVALFCVSCSSTPIDMKVMSFNVRYDNPGDSLNNWKYRKERVIETIASNGADICGAQEVLANQLADLKAGLPQYSFVGVGREDGVSKGEHSAVLYKTERFNLVESGHFWLSETPEAVGLKGWDAACERIATWVVLEDKQSSKKMFFINTHFDHEGQVARRSSVALLLERFAAKSGDMPAIITGDFNATPDSEVVKNMLVSGIVVDVKSLASEVTGPEWTYHEFCGLPLERRTLIDYIFVNDKITATTFKTIFEDKDGYLSDHNPIVAEIKLN